MKVKNIIKLIGFLAIFFFNAQLYAGLVPPYITASSSAELLTQGNYAGWYLYQIDIEWNLGQPGEGAGLSHWDIILKPNCALPDHLIEFDNPAGFSTSEDSPFDPEALEWIGDFLRNGDPSVSLIMKPVVKYEPGSSGEPGISGYGTFYFYSNIIPESGIYPDAIVGKAGNIPDTYGQLTGDYPSCTIVPEPTTIVIFGIGGGFFLLRKK